MITHRRNLYQVIDLSLPAAEIGVAEGYFAADILAWGIPKLYMVDAWQHLEVAGDGANTQAWHDKNFHNAKLRVAKYVGKYEILRGISWQMADQVPDNSLGYVNIDCDHSLQGVKADISAWWPKLVSGGVMSFHDHENPSYGVKIACAEFAIQNNLIVHLLPEDKKEDAGSYLVKP